MNETDTLENVEKPESRDKTKDSGYMEKAAKRPFIWRVKAKIKHFKMKHFKVGRRLRRKLRRTIKSEFSIDMVNAGDERRIAQPLIPYSPDSGPRKDLPHKYGKMDTLGRWQFDYIKQCGLKPHHRVLEIGPGGFRLAQHLVPYMEPSHYYAAEVSRHALDWGWQLLTDEERTRSPQLFWGGEFSFAAIGASFDFVWAHSVFTHLTWNEIGKCLYELRPTIAQDGLFLATYFRVENNLWQPHAYRRILRKGVDKRKNSYGHKDPFHYSFDVIDDLARRTGWAVAHVDLPDHPKSQSMLRFAPN